MRKKLLILPLLLISSIFSYSQTDNIKSSDFSHYTDCQRYNNWKTDKGDTLKIKSSFLFDNNGNVIRKLEEVPYQAPKTRELTVYHYNNNLINYETLYKVTDMVDIFDSKQIIYFYNKNGQIDSQMVINSYPYFTYKTIEGNADSTNKKQNTSEFNDPIWVPRSEYIDTSLTPRGIMTTIHDSEEMIFTGYKKVMKEVSLKEIHLDTLTNCKYYYNSKRQKIKEFFDAGEWNILGRTIIDYDKNGQFNTVFYYSKNTYKNQYHATFDSTNIRLKYISDNLSKEDLIKLVAKRVKEEMSDSLLRFNSYFEYNKDGSITETSVYSNRIYKLTSYRNKTGQILKTISSHTYVDNKYVNGRFIATDIKTLQFSDFRFSETTSIYEYDSLGRIIKCSKKYLDNETEGAIDYPNSDKEYRKSENFTIYKYNSNLPLKLPESEYVDGYSNDHYFYSIRQR